MIYSGFSYVGHNISHMGVFLPPRSQIPLDKKLSELTCVPPAARTLSPNSMAVMQINSSSTRKITNVPKIPSINSQPEKHNKIYGEETGTVYNLRVNLNSQCDTGEFITKKKCNFIHALYKTKNHNLSDQSISCYGSQSLTLHFCSISPVHFLKQCCCSGQ